MAAARLLALAAAICGLASVPADAYLVFADLNVKGPIDDASCLTDLSENCAPGQTGDAAKDACEAACDSDAECKGFVTHTYGGTLKKDFVTYWDACAVTRSGFTTYVKDSVSFFQAVPGVNLKGTEEDASCETEPALHSCGGDGQTGDDAYDGCAVACQEDAACQGFVTSPFGGTLKKDVLTYWDACAVARSGFTTYIKNAITVPTTSTTTATATSTTATATSTTVTNTSTTVTTVTTTVTNIEPTFAARTVPAWAVMAAAAMAGLA